MGGYVTADPDSRYGTAGTRVTKFGVGVNRKFTDGEGAQREEVCFVDVVAFGRLAEVCAEYVGKGRPIVVHGRATLESWNGRDGAKRTKIVLTARSVSFLGPDRAREEARAAGGPLGVVV